jgi:hypothetical protein
MKAAWQKIHKGILHRDEEKQQSQTQEISKESIS